MQRVVILIAFALLLPLAAATESNDFSDSTDLESGVMVSGYVTESDGDNPVDRYKIEVSPGDTVQILFTSNAADFCVYMGPNGSQQLDCFYEGELGDAGNVELFRKESTEFYYFEIDCGSTALDCSPSADYTLKVIIYTDEAGDSMDKAADLSPETRVSGWAALDESYEPIDFDYYQTPVIENDTLQVEISSNDMTSYRMYDQNGIKIGEGFEQGNYEFSVAMDYSGYLFIEIFCIQNYGEPCEYSLIAIGSTFVNSSTQGSQGPEAEDCVVHTNLIAHFHPYLYIEMQGEQKALPGNIGIDTTACPGEMHVVHTHAADNKLHVELAEEAPVFLALFFDVWNISFPENTTFNLLFIYTANVTISVDGEVFLGTFEELELQDAQVIEVVYWNNQTDSDGDGIPNDTDLCPGTYSWLTVDENGCAEEQLDDDDDGVSNAIDDCPNTPEEFNALNSRGCSFEDLQDSDWDGIPNFDDNCSNTPRLAIVDSSGCPSDSDADGVFNGIDECANTTQGSIVNSLGCSDIDGDEIQDTLDECTDTPFGATADSNGCPMDSDLDGVYDGLDECPSSNNPSPSEMELSSEVDATGCFVEAAEIGSDSESAAGVVGVMLLLALVLLGVRKVRNPKGEQMFHEQTQPIRSSGQEQFVPTPQASLRESELEQQSRQAQIEAQRLRKQLTHQAKLTQQLQKEAAQKQLSDAALAQKEQELAVAQQEKEELEAKLADAEKNTSIVQNITYNIQDSAISGDITNKIN